MAINSTTTQNLVPVMTVFNSDGSCAGLVGPGGNFLAVPIGAQTPSTGNFTTLTTTGNIGVGVTPSAWGASYRVLESGSATGFTIASNNANGFNYTTNAYNDGTNWIYKSNGGATLCAQANNTFYWYNAGAGVGGTTIPFAQAMALDGSGNLGLGTTPSAWSGFRTFEMTGGYVANSDSTGIRIGQNNYYNGSAWTYKTTAAATMYYQTTGQHIWYTAPSGTAGNAISFTQAMTLDTSASLLIGATNTLSGSNCVIASGIIVSGQPTASGYTNVNSAQLEGSSGRIIANHINGTATASLYAGFGYNGASIGSITQSGTTAVLYNTTSDQRLKENIVDADSASSLIDAVQVRQFDWKSDGSHSRYGFIAQELVEVVPEAVHVPADDTEMMGVDFSKLVPLLVKEVQELRARVAVLEGKKR